MHSHLQPAHLRTAGEAQEQVPSKENHGGQQEGIDDGISCVWHRIDCHDVRDKQHEEERHCLQALEGVAVQHSACAQQLPLREQLSRAAQKLAATHSAQQPTAFLQEKLGEPHSARAPPPHVALSKLAHRRHAGPQNQLRCIILCDGIASPENRLLGAARLLLPEHPSCKASPRCATGPQDA